MYDAKCRETEREQFQEHYTALDTREGHFNLQEKSKNEFHVILQPLA
jgi:hypothetical protein